MRYNVDYSSQLRHFARTNMFVDDFVPIDDQIFDQTNEPQGDEWDSALEDILDSESDAELRVSHIKPRVGLW